MQLKERKGGKQGMTAGFLVSLIIVILAFMLIASVILRFYATGEDREAELLCKDSLALRSTAALQINDKDLKLSPVACKTIDKKVKGDEQEVMKALADKMARCWWMMGEGTIEGNVFDNTDFMGSDSKCFMCYVMLVEESDEFTGRVSAQEFEDYLTDTSYPKRKDETYLEYILQGRGAGYVTTVLTPEGITSGRAYGIAFKAKTKECGDFCKWTGQLGAGAAIGGVIGAVTFAPVAGALLAVGGTAVASVVTYEDLKEFFTDRPKIDSIMVVDMGDETLNKVMEDTCPFISDIAGK